VGLQSNRLRVIRAVEISDRLPDQAGDGRRVGPLGGRLAAVSGQGAVGGDRRSLRQATVPPSGARRGGRGGHPPVPEAEKKGRAAS
jgi:hypothetical protein